MPNAWGRRLCAFLFATALAAGTGCASVAPPGELIAAAEESVRKAEDAEAQRYAPLELYQAREKLVAAQGALQAGENLRARRLAEQALVQADLAEAKADTGRAKRSVEQLRRSIEALRAEIEASSPGGEEGEETP